MAIAMTSTRKSQESIGYHAGARLVKQKTNERAWRDSQMTDKNAQRMMLALPGTFVTPVSGIRPLYLTSAAINPFDQHKPAAIAVEHTTFFILDASN